MINETTEETVAEKIYRLHKESDKKKDIYDALVKEFGIAKSTARITWMYNQTLPNGKEARILEVIESVNNKA